MERFHSDMPLVISAYTPDSHLGDYYKRSAQKLVDSLIYWDLEHYIVPIKGNCGWADFMRLKLQFIVETLMEVRRPVLWIDADARVLKFPSLFQDFEFDVGAVVHEGRFLGGTMYFQSHPGVFGFLYDWIHASMNPQLEIPDEDSFPKVRRFLDDLNFAEIDKSYNTTVQKGSDLTNVVIAHYMRPDVAAGRGLEVLE